MKTIQILEDEDTVQAGDWCRPLALTFDRNIEICYESAYSGAPINNTRWAKVEMVFGPFWKEKTVRELNGSGPTYNPYEFVRGDIPHDHQLRCFDRNKFGLWGSTTND